MTVNVPFSYGDPSGPVISMCTEMDLSAMMIRYPP